MKLSAVQLAILRRMEKGEEITLCAKGVRVDHLFIMAWLGLIESVGAGWCGAIWDITPAGRAYLEEHDEAVD